MKVPEFLNRLSKANRATEEAIQDGIAAMLQRGAVIYTELKKPELGLTEHLILTPTEFQALRMFLIEERPHERLDVIWSYDEDSFKPDGALHERYTVRLDWDIHEIIAQTH